ncbi:putative sm-like protein Lsm6/SmF [Helianthus anomalus]
MSGTVAAAEKGSSTTKIPYDFLKSIRGRSVVVKLNSDVDCRGVGGCFSEPADPAL